MMEHAHQPSNCSADSQAFLACRRMKWRKQQPITVLELKCRRLDTPLVFLQDDALYGCFSWLDLHKQVQGFQAEGQYVVGEDRFREKQAGVRAALQKVEAIPIL